MCVLVEGAAPLSLPYAAGPAAGAGTRNPRRDVAGAGEEGALCGRAEGGGTPQARSGLAGAGRAVTVPFSVPLRDTAMRQACVVGPHPR